MAHSGSTDARPASDTKLQIRRTFQASPDRLFAAWTTPEELKRWHAPGQLTVAVADVDLRMGGRYRIEMQEPDEGAVHKVSGIYRVVDPPNKLVYTWQWEGDPAETQVTLEFLSRGTGTELVLTHEGFADGDSRAHHEQGWTSILERLGGQLPAAL